MRFKVPKNTEKISWTQHCLQKMQFYGLSETKVRSVLYRPKRKEEGIAPATIAQMKPGGTKRRPTEIWIMIQEYKYRGRPKIKMISAWRYPGVSKPREPIPIPEDIKEELEEILESEK